MSRYIDGDALLEIIDHYILHDEDARKHHSALFVEGMKDGYYRIKSKVLNMPIADVAPVVHGEWIYDKTSTLWECSNCHEEEIRSTTYCPHCGARNRGGR